MDAAWPLIGREDELAAIASAIDAGAAGPVGIVVTGEPGIGKSAVLTSALDRLRALRWRVIAGQADALERGIPYAALARLVEPLAADRDADVGAAADGLLDLLRDPEASFGLVCGRATELAQAMLEGRGVAVGIDDVDALDDDTLALLAILVRRLPTGRLAILATSRTERPAPESRLAELLSRLEQNGRLHRVTLAPLGPDPIARIVEAAVGEPTGRDRAADLHRRAEGNPFFALQLAVADAPTAGDALRKRITPSDPDSRAALEAVAVLGSLTPGRLPTVAGITGLDDRTLAAALDRLVDGGVLRHDERGWRFSHDLAREAVYSGIGAARQHVLHRAVANALLAERAAGHGVDVQALARHVAVVAGPGDVEAASLLAEAADRSRAAAPRSAIAAYQRALDVLPADDERRASLLARQSRAASLAGTPVLAADIGQRALAALPAGAERARTAWVVVNSLVELGQLEEAARVADAEVALTRSPNLVADRAWVLWLLGRHDEAVAEAEAANAMPTSSPSERALVLGPLGVFAASLQRPRPLPETTSELLDLADGLPPTLQLYAYAVASYALATSCYARLATAPLERAEALHEEQGGTAFRGNVLVGRVFADWLHGRWEEAVDGIGASLTELEGASFATQVGALHAIDIAIRSARGERIPDTLLHDRPPTSNFADLRAWSVAGALLSAGDTDGARAVLDDATAKGERYLAYASAIHARRVEVELQAGNPGAAAIALKAVEEEGEARPHPWTTVHVHLSRAVVHRDADAARAAVQAADDGGYVEDTARARLVLGELDAGETEALVAAYKTFQALGADPWRRRAGAVLRERGVAVPRQRTARKGLLTEAELKIGRLVQQGMRNREIASVLHYSPRTVEVYLSRIYAKLGVASRLELARALDTRVD